MNKVTKYLNGKIDGQVYDRPNILAAYSRDMSLLEITPKLVAVPKTTEDIQFLVRTSNMLAEKGFKLPLAVRGSGLDKTGGDLCEGMVISTEKMNKIEELDDRSRLVRVQAGVTVEKLNAVLAAYNLTLPLDVDPRETIGGLISKFELNGNAKKYGTIFYYLDRLEAVLSNGDLFQSISYTPRGLKNVESGTTFESQIYQQADKLISNNFDILSEARPDQSSGFPMLGKVKDEKRKTFDLAPVFFGANGTLGIITEVILRVEPLPREAKRVLVAFNSVEKAVKFTDEIAKFAPARVDFYDSRIFKVAEAHGKKLSLLEPLVEGEFYVIAKFDDSKMKNKKSLRQALSLASSCSNVVLETLSNTDDFNLIESLLPLYVNDENHPERSLATDDMKIPRGSLADFYKELKTMEEIYHQDLPLFGSLLTSVFHLRPSFDLSDVTERKKSLKFTLSLSRLAHQYHGHLAGSDGRIKSVAEKDSLSERQVLLYQELKHIFDPNNILNPEAKLGASFADIVSHLRKDDILGIK